MNCKPVVDVSIIAPNFNHKSYLPKFFESVIDSSVLPVELIIVDDASNDGSQRVIEDYASRYSFIRPLFLGSNEGVASSANKGLDVASAKYAMRVDTDDYVHPHRIENQFRYLETHPEVDVLGGNCYYFSSASGQVLLKSSFPSEIESINALFHRGENGVLNGATMTRAHWFDSFRYRQEAVWAEDYDLFARMLHGGAVFAGEKNPLTYVRIHSGSATSNLEFQTLLKAHVLSVELFGNRKPIWRLKQEFHHLVLFRKALLATTTAERLFFFGLAAAVRPEKLLKRLRWQ